MGNFNKADPLTRITLLFTIVECLVHNEFVPSTSAKLPSLPKFNEMPVGTSFDLKMKKLCFFPKKVEIQVAEARENSKLKF